MTARFSSMGCEVVVLGASPVELAAVEALFARRDGMFSRFRPESELNRVNGTHSSPLLVSDELARIVKLAIAAAQSTGGAVTPTVGAAVVAVGYDREFAELGPDAPPAAPAEVPPWQRVRVRGRWLWRDGPVVLDLNGVVKGATADEALALLRGGGSVAAGGDVATTRRVDVALPGGGAVTLRRGGLATSGTDRRRWTCGGDEQHHLIDPRTARPSASPWRTVTVAAGSCVAADVAAKAALLVGDDGGAWLDRHGLPGRFVDAAGHVTTNASWATATNGRLTRAEAAA